MSDADKMEFIVSLSPAERDAYAEMIMRSLRGSWTNPMARANILRQIASVGGTLVYDSETLDSKAARYLDRGLKRNEWDGRYFRRYYGQVDLFMFPEDRIRLMASNIPNDMTWDDWRIERIYEDRES